MTRHVITVVFLCLGQIIFSQSTLSKKFIASKGTWELPVRHGYLSLNKSCLNPNPDYVTILSDSSRPVTAVFEGTVTMIDMYDSLFLMVVKSGEYFVGYSNLATVSVKKGDDVKKGDQLGNAGKDLDEKFVVDLRVSGPSGELKVKPWFKKDVKQLRSKSVSGDAQRIYNP